MPELWPLSTMKSWQTGWGIRQRVKSKVSRNSETQLWAKHGKELWNKTILDVQLVFCLGPYTSEDEVSAVLQTDARIAMPRFRVLQGGKSRPADDGSATGSHANGFSAITERLTLPTMDMARALKQATGESIGRWVMDETSAFRQLPTLPRDRPLAVIILEKPETNIVSYFVMIGHPFGLTPNVYNHNRRAAVLTGFPACEFCLLCRSHSDDRFGLTRSELAESEVRLVEQVCFWLGVDVNGKTECGQRFDLLGVSLDCVGGRFKLKQTRKDNLEGELPGAAAKLRGKLQFVAGHCAGRHGRAFFTPFQERQYSSSKDCTLSRSLDGAVRSWLHVLASDLRPRSLYAPSGA